MGFRAKAPRSRRGRLTRGGHVGLCRRVLSLLGLAAVLAGAEPAAVSLGHICPGAAGVPLAPEAAVAEEAGQVAARGAEPSVPVEEPRQAWAGQPVVRASWDRAGADSAPGTRRVVRGGSFYDRPRDARCAARRAHPAWQAVYDVGFRVVCYAP